MNVRVISLLGVLLAAAGWASAQPTGTTGSRGFPVKSELSGQAESPSATSRMYEDIEILRRILNRSLNLPRYATSPALNYFPAWSGGMYGGTPGFGGFGGGNMPQNQSGLNTLSSSFLMQNGLQTQQAGYGMVPYSSLEYAGAEGVYLKGCGVVYTATLPASPRDLKPAAPRPAPKSLSEWERVRKQLHGEKVEPESKEGGRPSPSLADRILKVLADNGHHFSQLKEHESVVVVVTIHGNAATHPANQTTTASGGSKSTQSHSATTGSSSGGTSSSTTTDDGRAAPAKGSDYELLGDLHVKQGRLREAIQAYKKAAEAKLEPKQAAAVYRKLAQALLSLDETDTAALHGVLKAYEEALGRTKQQPRNPPATGGALPVKLIISATKRQLDTVGAGAISFDEFKARGASVEVLPATADKTLSR